MRLELDLRSAQTGSSLRLTGQYTVFNLGSGEAEAFFLAVSCENTLNLVCLEAEFVGRQFRSAQRALLDSAIVVASASDVYPGAIVPIERKSILDALIATETGGPLGDVLPKVSQEEMVDLCLRGVAFLCEGDIATWRHLRSRFEELDEWGSILASFSEYANSYPCSGEIANYLDDWLVSPGKISRITVWDIEARAVTVLKNRLEHIREDVGRYLLRVLDATIVVNDPVVYSDSEPRQDILLHLRRMSLLLLRAYAASSLAEHYKGGAVEALIAFLITSDIDGGIIKVLEEITSAGLIESEWRPLEEESEGWVDWWTVNSGRFPPVLPLHEYAPTMSRAFDARTTTDCHWDYLTDDVIVRKNLAQNPHTALQELVSLARDAHAEVRRVLATRDNLPVEVVKQLSRDTSPVVRHYLASNRTLAIETLEDLAKDLDEVVRKQAQSTIAYVASRSSQA
jgi:hypothetical protein